MRDLSDSGIMMDIILSSIFMYILAITVVASLGSYPIDTIRRRMMMTSGTGVFYKSSMDAGVQIMKAEGVTSFFKGAGK
jgi:solute carrier family 25 (adenine nucleotide translocator) protein 4/5/6/31